MITFNKDITLQVVEGFDEKTDTITSLTVETFKKGEKVDADVYSENDFTVDIQFGDGSVSIGVPKDSFQVID